MIKISFYKCLSLFIYFCKFLQSFSLLKVLLDKKISFLLHTFCLNSTNNHQHKSNVLVSFFVCSFYLNLYGNLNVLMILINFYRFKLNCLHLSCDTHIQLGTNSMQKKKIKRFKYI